MKLRLISAFALVLPVLVFSGCNDDEDPTQPAQTGTVTLQLSHMAGTEPLQLNSTDYYTSPAGQQYRVSDFKYYLSNLKFQGQNLQLFSEPESYHFVNQTDPGSLKIAISQMQPGTYDTLLFAIGVDNNRNHTGAQIGALDPANGMSWGWTTGYKFLQLEGFSPLAPAPNTLLYHIGLDQNYRLVRIGLSPALVVTANSRHTINLKADVNRIFGTAENPVSFATMHNVMFDPDKSAQIANNYAKMFSFQSLTTD